MIAARSSRVRLALRAQVVEVDRAVVGGLDDDDAHAGHHRGGGVGAVGRRRDQADVAAGVAVGAVVATDREQPGQLALRAGVGLDRDPVVAGHLGQPALELVDQPPVAGGVLGRRERVQVGEAGQAHRLHLGGGVELHRARAERDHAAVQRVVARRQPPQVAQHLGLGPVAVEHRVLEERRTCGAARRAARRACGCRRRPARRRPRRRRPAPCARVAGRCVRSSEIPTWSSSTRRSWSPAAWAASTTSAPAPGRGPARCRRTRPCTTSTPPSRNAAASTAAQRWVRRAMERSPSAPW